MDKLGGLNWNWTLKTEFKPNIELPLWRSSAIEIRNRFTLFSIALFCWKYRWPLFPRAFQGEVMAENHFSSFSPLPSPKNPKYNYKQIFWTILSGMKTRKVEIFTSSLDQISFGWDEGVSLRSPPPEYRSNPLGTRSRCTSSKPLLYPPALPPLLPCSLHSPLIALLGHQYLIKGVLLWLFSCCCKVSCPSSNPSYTRPSTPSPI